MQNIIFNAWSATVDRCPISYITKRLIPIQYTIQVVNFFYFIYKILYLMPGVLVWNVVPSLILQKD